MRIRKTFQSNVTKFADTFHKVLPEPVQPHFERTRVLWDSIVQIRFKHLLYVGLVLGLLVGSFQIQVNALNANRFDDACDARLTSRAETSLLLKQIVDLSDVLPDSDEAKEYTEQREQLIEDWRVGLQREDCA